jgi:hypothetical protein
MKRREELITLTDLIAVKLCGAGQLGSLSIMTLISRSKLALKLSSSLFKRLLLFE